MCFYAVWHILSHLITYNLENIITLIKHLQVEKPSVLKLLQSNMGSSLSTVKNEKCKLKYFHQEKEKSQSMTCSGQFHSQRQKCGISGLKFPFAPNITDNIPVSRESFRKFSLFHTTRDIRKRGYL